MDDKFWYLKNCDLFQRISAEQVQRIEACSRSRSFERNSLVYLPSDSSDAVLLLVSGRVKLYHITSDGKQALLALIEPGELFGELALVEPGQREEFAEARVASQIVLIPRNQIELLMNEHPQVALSATRLIGLRRKRVERRLKSLLFRSNRERLIFLLLELAEKYGQACPEGVELNVRLSHQELANIIGSTRETVTVLLGELQQERSLLIRRRRITLCDVRELASTIDIPSPQVPSPNDLGDTLLPQP
ncbi:MAG: transcriptional regulator [Planctomycetaceae bacterium]|nr:transcriptional regulator [Planctomycetaceae bacterium]